MNATVLDHSSSPQLTKATLSCFWGRFRSRQLLLIIHAGKDISPIDWAHGSLSSTRTGPEAFPTGWGQRLLGPTKLHLTSSVLSPKMQPYAHFCAFPPFPGVILCQTNLSKIRRGLVKVVSWVPELTLSWNQKVYCFSLLQLQSYFFMTS